MPSFTKQGDNTPRRLVKIEPEEVSLVGRPANEREFLVLKGTAKTQGGEPMGIFTDDKGKGSDNDTPIAKGITEVGTYLEGISKGDDPFGGEVADDARAEIVKGLGEDLTSALGTVVEGLSKFVGDEAIEWPGKVEAPEGETPVAKAFEILTDLDAADLDTEVLKAAMPDDLKAAIKATTNFLGRALAGKFPAAGDTDKGDKGAGKVSKGAAGDTDGGTPAGTEIDPEALDDALTGILKAKRITPARMKALKEFRKGFDDLLKAFGAEDDEEDPDMKGKAAGKGGKGKVAKGEAAADEGDGDAAADEGDDKLDKILKAVEGLGERVDKIEKTRTPSKEPAGDDGDGGTKVNKGDDGVGFGGLFLPTGHR